MPTISTRIDDASNQCLINSVSAAVRFSSTVLETSDVEDQTDKLSLSR